MKTTITLIIGALVAAIILPEKVVIAGGLVLTAGFMTILIGGMLAGHEDLNR